MMKRSMRRRRRRQASTAAAASMRVNESRPGLSGWARDAPGSHHVTWLVSQRLSGRGRDAGWRPEPACKSSANPPFHRAHHGGDEPPCRSNLSVFGTARILYLSLQPRRSGRKQLVRLDENTCNLPSPAVVDHDSGEGGSEIAQDQRRCRVRTRGTHTNRFAGSGKPERGHDGYPGTRIIKFKFKFLSRAHGSRLGPEVYPGAGPASIRSLTASA
eukprot:900114-Rhodomonas_salina.1